MTPEERTASQFRWQADACRALGSALYATLLDRCADDLVADGPTADVLAGHLDHRRREVLQLRMLAGVHALVLAGRAPELAEFYPSVGGRVDDADRLWQAFRAVLVDHRDDVRSWLSQPPQTNEVGRAAALAGALRHLVAAAPMPVRLLELGASAGLNLRADRFRITGPAGPSGPPSSALVLDDAWLGAAPPDVAVDVVERVGFDLAPIDPTTEDGANRLLAYVWPDQVPRIERLRAALAVARQVPAELRAGDAVEVVRALSLRDGAWTVLWHSVFRQYLEGDRYDDLAAAIADLGDRTTGAARLAHVMLEPEPSSPADAFPVVVTTWPGGHRRLIGTAPAHGVPVTWLDAVRGEEVEPPYGIEP